MRSTSCSSACPISTGWPKRQKIGGNCDEPAAPLQLNSFANRPRFDDRRLRCASSACRRGIAFRRQDRCRSRPRDARCCGAQRSPIPLAIDLAEKAVAKNPDDAGFRALLGNTYFAGGRFRSAEAAYKDSLTIYPKQPQVVLKLALVQIALGKNDEASTTSTPDARCSTLPIMAWRSRLPAAPIEAIAVLDPAAREPGADATVRQNLALAHALRGDWAEAKTIAAQDVPAGQLDARMQQWMQLASPKHAAHQVAALVGVTPAASDAGQPVQLALNKGDTAPRRGCSGGRTCRSQAAQVAPEFQSLVKPAFVATAAPSRFLLRSLPLLRLRRRRTSAPLPRSPRRRSTKAKSVLAYGDAHTSPAPKLAQAAPRGCDCSPWQFLDGGPARCLWLARPRARCLEQGRAQIWRAQGLSPMSARFASAKGTFYRLSVRGFSGMNEANALCNSLRRRAAAASSATSPATRRCNIAMR